MVLSTYIQVCKLVLCTGQYLCTSFHTLTIHIRISCSCKKWGFIICALSSTYCLRENSIYSHALILYFFLDFWKTWVVCAVCTWTESGSLRHLYYLVVFKLWPYPDVDDIRCSKREYGVVCSITPRQKLFAGLEFTSLLWCMSCLSLNPVIHM